MTDNKILPIPDTSGSSGTQEPSKGLEASVSKPLEGLHIAKTIEGLAISHSKSLGGEVSSTLLACVTSQLSYNYQELQNEYKELSSKYESQREKLESSRMTVAVLKERIRSEGNNKILRNLCITIGTSLIATGVFLSRSNLDNYSYGAYGFGVILFLLGWFSNPKVGEKE